LGFRLLARPPYGATRIKAIVTKSPLPLAGSANAGQVFRSVQLGEVVSGAGTAVRPDWASAEIEFLVVPKNDDARNAAPAARVLATDDPAPAPSICIAEAWPLLKSAAEALSTDDSTLSTPNLAVLRWPLKSPFDSHVDIGWRQPAPDARPCSVRIGVVDADFDPDDPFLLRSFALLTADVREEMRAEIRRNGRATFRHGNRWRRCTVVAGGTSWRTDCPHSDYHHR
jgi:hypothetical protein